MCDYVVAVIKHDTAYQQVWNRLNGLGGLTITTTLDPRDQRAANHAVNYVLPAPPIRVNPGKNADTEVLIQPGTGKVRAIAIDRPYGTGRHQNTVNYAVGRQYNGGQGVQIGSTGKVYVMVTALLQGIPFGYTKTVPASTQVSGYTNCKGQPVGQFLPNGQLGWQVHNDESEPGGHFSLYTGTTESINVFFAYLEQKVGLCDTVKTAARMGLTWADGTSLLKPDRRSGNPLSADNIPSFTLGAVSVTPMAVAAADATLPARGIFCSPIAITKIVTTTGQRLPVESANCRRVLPREIADAGNYILQGDLNGHGTATADNIPAACRRQDRDSGQLHVRVLHRLHAGPARGGLGGQPDRPQAPPHAGHGLLLPVPNRAVLPRVHVRLDGTRQHLAEDIPARRAGQPAAQLRVGSAVEPAVVVGRRHRVAHAAVAPPPPPRRRRGWRRWRRWRRRWPPPSPRRRRGWRRQPVGCTLAFNRLLLVANH